MNQAMKMLQDSSSPAFGVTISFSFDTILSLGVDTSLSFDTSLTLAEPICITPPASTNDSSDDSCSEQFFLLGLWSFDISLFRASLGDLSHTEKQSPKATEHIKITTTIINTEIIKSETPNDIKLLEV